MPDDHAAALIRIVEAAPWAYLDELSAELFFEQGIGTSRGRPYPLSTLCRNLRAWGYTRKKLRDLTKNRNLEIMQTFTQLMGYYRAEL